MYALLIDISVLPYFYKYISLLLQYSVSNDTSLFWALRGGGSAFGIILDMDIKMHKDNKIAQAICTYSYIESKYSTY